MSSEGDIREWRERVSCARGLDHRDWMSGSLSFKDEESVEAWLLAWRNGGCRRDCRVPFVLKRVKGGKGWMFMVYLDVSCISISWWFYEGVDLFCSHTPWCDVASVAMVFFRAFRNFGVFWTCLSLQICSHKVLLWFSSWDVSKVVNSLSYKRHWV